MQPDFKHLIRICDNINRTIARIPYKAAVLAVNFTKERFIKKNWLDDREHPWPKTKKRKGSTLMKSGRLKKSIHQVHIGADYAIVGTNVPYARPHNDGLTIAGTEQVRAHGQKSHKRKAYTRSGKRIKAGTVRAHIVKSHSRKFKRSFVQRKFIGQSQYLNNQITEMIQDEFQKSIRT